MIAMKPYGWPLLALVAVLQTGVLAKVIWDRDRLLKTGREVILPVVPVDPRDIFRGDYATLGYALNTVTVPKSTLSAEEARRSTEIYVTWRKQADGTWQAVAVSPALKPAADDNEVVVKGRVLREFSFSGAPLQPGDLGQLRVTYGIERYFVPEGTGGALEKDVRDKAVEAIVKIGRDGTAALSGLVIGGQRHEAPPLL